MTDALNLGANGYWRQQQLRRKFSLLLVAADFTPAVIHIKPVYHVSARKKAPPVSLSTNIKVWSPCDSITTWLGTTYLCRYELADLRPPRCSMKAKGATERLTVRMKSCDKSRNGSTSICRLYTTILQLRVQTFSFTCHCESPPHNWD